MKNAPIKKMIRIGLWCFGMVGIGKLLQIPSPKLPVSWMQGMQALEDQTIGATRVLRADTVLTNLEPLLLQLPERAENGDTIVYYEAKTQKDSVYITDKSLLWYPPGRGIFELIAQGYNESEALRTVRYVVRVW